MHISNLSTKARESVCSAIIGAHFLLKSVTWPDFPFSVKKKRFVYHTRAKNILEWNGKRSTSPQRGSCMFKVLHSTTCQRLDGRAARAGRHLRVFPFSVFRSLKGASSFRGTIAARCSRKNGTCHSHAVVGVYLLPFATLETSDSFSSLTRRGGGICGYLRGIYPGNWRVAVGW